MSFESRSGSRFFGKWMMSPHRTDKLAAEFFESQRGRVFAVEQEIDGSNELRADSQQIQALQCMMPPLLTADSPDGWQI